MKTKSFGIEGPLLFEANFLRDERGYFTETFRADIFCDAAGPYRFVQENRSLSNSMATIRGLHYQKSPMAQGKLVICEAGSIFDVAVDIRPASATFGHHVSVVLKGDDGLQFWIPPGFAHGFCTLTPDCVVRYKVTEYYSPKHESGLAWDDPDIAIDWPINAKDVVLSSKDRHQPLLRDVDNTSKEN